jgi:hypothetical protein
VVHKDPNREVSDRIDLVFQTFVQVRSACKVLRMFTQQGLLIPRRNRFGEITWRKPSVAVRQRSLEGFPPQATAIARWAILSILKNPAY